MSSEFMEWIGYAASAMIVISLIMTDIVKLRILNSIGCFIFVVYGCVIKAYPVAIANGLIIFINIYNLYKLKNENIAK
ncbi:MAG: YgjV family protein [Clostridium chrysemydis]|uniref:YgjV family protein n=1 Tax=Clostridium chrysemydis TaxID=2665504 RepID=UPI003F3D1B4B